MSAVPHDHDDLHPREAHVLRPGHTFGSVTDHISSIVLTRKTGKGWLIGFLLSFLLTNVLLGAARRC